jgi:pimeloyl-ACP methyl ester carboxylesterase
MPDYELQLVLLPGMDGTGMLFRDFLEELPPPLKVRTICYPVDRPMSEDQLLSFLQLQLPSAQPIVLLAESYSTPLAIRFAATHPPNLRALILCSGFASSPVRGLMRWLFSRITPALVRLPPSDFFMKLFLIGQTASPVLLGDVRKAIAAVHADTLSSRLQAILAGDVRTELRKVKVPSLYMQASSDLLVPLRCGHEILRILPSTSMVVIDGPHLLLQREPRLSAKVVVDFLEGQQVL